MNERVWWRETHARFGAKLFLSTGIPSVTVIERAIHLHRAFKSSIVSFFGLSLIDLACILCIVEILKWGGVGEFIIISFRFPSLPSLPHIYTVPTSLLTSKVFQVWEIPTNRSDSCFSRLPFVEQVELTYHLTFKAPKSPNRLDIEVRKTIVFF